jgi:hypothetical protein
VAAAGVYAVRLSGCLSAVRARLVVRRRRRKKLELLVLRHELSILRRQPRRPRLTGSDRLLLAALGRVAARGLWHAFLITPETLLGWQRRIVAHR